jgi:hypothetical protein
MLLGDPLPSDFLNANLPSATITSVGVPLRPASILAEYLLCFLAEFPVTGLGRYRHTASRLPSVFNSRGATVQSQVGGEGMAHLAELECFLYASLV